MNIFIQIAIFLILIRTGFYSWAKEEYVKVKYIGEAKEGSEKGVVCASYHAG